MKKIFLLIALFVSFKVFGQFTQPMNFGSKTTLVTNKGGFVSDSALILPHFNDTASANLGPAPKFYPGNLIRTIDDTLWFRNQTATKWIKIGGSAATTITADNGLTMSTATNVQLGGTLLQNTSVDVTANYALTITGSNASSAGTLIAENTGGGIGAYGHAVGGIGVFGETTGGYGVYGLATNGVGVYGVSQTGTYAVGGSHSGSGNGIYAASVNGIAGNLISYPSSTNTVVTALNVERQSTGTAANGIGVALDLRTQAASGAQFTSNRLISKLTDATFATRTSQFIITGVESAVTQNVLVINGDGSIQFPQYVGGDFAGTPAYGLAVDASGNVIVTSVPGGGSGTVTNFSFTDANGFDGTVTNATTTPNLTLTTTLTQGSVFFAGASGAINEDNSNLFFDNTSNILGIGKNSSFGATRLEIVDNSIAGASMVKLTTTSTQAASSIQKLLEISSTGTNASAGQATYGIYSSNTHDGSTSTNYGIYGTATSGTSNNYGVYGNGTQFGVYGNGATGVRGDGTTYGVRGFTSTAFGTGVYGESTSSGAAGWFIGTGSAFGAQLNSIDAVTLAAIRNPASTNSVVAIGQFQRQTSGTAANGIGGSLDLYLESDGGSSSIANQIIWKYTTAASATRTSQLIINGVNSAVTSDLFTLSGTGQLQLNKYGVGTFTGTPAHTLQVDASGNIIEGSGGGGGGTGSNLSYDAANHEVDIDGGGTSAVIPLAVADGATEGLASFTAADFDATAGNISIDYTNGQAASGANKGFLTSADWTTFNNKANAALDNLSSVAINASLLPGTDNAIDLGSATKQWKDLYMTGASIYMSGVKTLSAAGLDLPTGGGIRTRTSAGNTILFQAYDVDGAAYSTFATLTANNTPTFDLSSSVTVGGASILTTTAAALAYQPLDADLTTWAGITPGSNVGTFLATPSSANLRGALTDENGTGVALFNAATTPSFTTGIQIGGAAASRKILVGDGTNFVPSTETWATPSTTGNVLTSDGTNWVSSPTVKYAAATAGTTTNNTLTDLTGMSIALTAGTWVFDIWIFGQAGTGTAGAQFGVNYTGTTTSIEANCAGQVSTTTFAATTRITAINTASVVVFTTSAAEGWVHISGKIVVSDAGNLVARGLKVTSQTLTWRASSWMKAYKVS